MKINIRMLTDEQLDMFRILTEHRKHKEKIRLQQIIKEYKRRKLEGKEE